LYDDSRNVRLRDVVSTATCHVIITRSSTIKDLGVVFHSKLHFHENVDYPFSDYIQLLALIGSVHRDFPPWSVCIYCTCFSQVQVGICLGSLELHYFH
jgi:hypothetical protein